MAFIPTLDSSRLLRKKFINPQSLAELAVEANVWRTAQDNRYVTRAEYVAGGSGIAPTIFDAKGDLIVASANDTPLRFPVGTNGQMLVPDSNLTAGIKWATRPALYTNLLINPSVETNTTGIGPQNTGVTTSRVTTEFYTGTASARAVCDGTVSGQGVYFATNATQPVGIYAGAAWVKATAGTLLEIYIQGSSPVGQQFTATGSWQRVTAPTGARTTPGDTVLVVATVGPQAVTFYVDAGIVVAGTEVPDYFDGDTAGCYWTGTAHASTSVRTAPSAADTVGRGSMPTLTRNLVTNPSFELGITDWGNGPNSTVTRSTGAGLFGVAGAVVTHTAASGGNAYIYREMRVEAGTHTWSFYMRVASGSPTLVTTVYGDALGVGPILTTGQITPTGTYARYTVTFTTAVARQIVLLADFATAVNGEAVHTDAWQLESGSFATEYTDGDQPGCYWTGTPHASESIRMVASKTATDRNITGRGSPEGVVTAGVGVRYTDEAATNGAVEWIKAANPGLATGWKVVYGDTGWRNVSSLLINGNAGAFYMRRVGNTVHFSTLTTTLDATARTSDQFLNISSVSGFVPQPNGAIGMAQASDFSALTRLGVSAGVFYLDSGTTKQYVITGTAPTDQAWPTTLPGTAA